MSDLPPRIPPSDGHSTAQKSADNIDLSVLILSQDSDTRFLFRTLLEIWGYHIEESDNLEDSLSAINKQPPSLILLDSFPPFEESLEIIRRLRQDRFSKDIPIIMISGFAEPIYRSLSLVTGADGFFVKPVDFDRLEFCLKKNIGKNASTEADL